jgi:hypothetical protein
LIHGDRFCFLTASVDIAAFIGTREQTGCRFDRGRVVDDLRLRWFVISAAARLTIGHAL